jgi:hypothetical protein
MEWYTHSIGAFLLPLSGSDLPPTISRHSSRADKETKMVADYGDYQMNQDHMTGAGHKGVASGTQYHNGRQDGSIRCTTTKCNNHSSILWRRAGEPRADNGCRAQGCCK